MEAVAAAAEIKIHFNHYIDLIMKQAILKITEMSCPNCAIVNENDLRKANGVIRANISFEAKQAIIEYDEKKITSKEIMEIITKNGYGAFED
jgi:P-type Cu+ transporter